MTDTAGHRRARRLYPLGVTCEHDGCDDPAVDRHHVDGNSSNNAPENIRRLCRRHHMEEDGRLRALAQFDGQREAKPPKPCSNCQKLAKPLRRGRCGGCAEYLRRTGDERPVDAEGNSRVQRFVGLVA